MYGVCVCVCVRVPHFFICLSGDRHLGCFYILAVINDAAMNTEVHVSFLISIFVFFGYIPSNGSPASCDSFFNIYFYLFIYLFLTVLGLRCCVGFSLVVASECGGETLL